MSRASDAAMLARRHPWIVDAALAAAIAAASATLAAGRGDVSGIGWMWFAGIHLPLVWRRRAPVVVFWTIVITGAVWEGVSGNVVGPSVLAVPLFAIYAIGRYRSRRHLWPVAALVLLFAAGWVAAGGLWWDALALAALYAASALLGMNLQTRRAYLAELEDRARRLERERDQQAQLAVAAERARIAREMHDIVAHNLAVMVALSDGAAATTATDPQRAVDMMKKTSSTGREALGEIRRLVGLLRDGEADGQPADAARAPAPTPGLGDIDALVDYVRAAGLKVALTQEGMPGVWGPGAGLAVYRIVQEALTNTMKHAGREATAEVRLRYSATGADVEIVDDGGRVTQRANGQPARGLGLAGMSERVASYGGHVEAGPRSGSGWRVHARLSFDTSEVT